MAIIGKKDEAGVSMAYVDTIAIDDTIVGDQSRSVEDQQSVGSQQTPQQQPPSHKQQKQLDHEAFIRQQQLQYQQLHQSSSNFTLYRICIEELECKPPNLFNLHDNNNNNSYTEEREDRSRSTQQQQQLLQTSESQSSGNNSNNNNNSQQSQLQQQQQQLQRLAEYIKKNAKRPLRGGSVTAEDALAKLRKERELYLDIASETGQITRRLYAGQFSCPSRRRMSHMCHVTSTPISLYLFDSTNKRIGSHTLLDLSPTIDSSQIIDGEYENIASSSSSTSTSQSSNNNQKYLKVLTYARRGLVPVYQLKYSISPVRYQYQFLLQDVTCLRQKRWRSSPDKFYAEVEFNYSPHNINAQPTSRYQLGLFSTSDSSNAFCNHHFSFSAVSSFRIRFYVQNYSYLHNTLIDEWIFGIETNNHHADDDHDNNNNEEEPPADDDGAEYITWAHSKRNEHDIISFQHGDEISKTITVSGEGLSYLMVFSIRRQQIFFDPPVQQQAHPTTHGAKEEEEEEPAQKNLQQQHHQQQQASESASSVNLRNFSDLSMDNHIEILIDGLQTFERYYQYMMQAQKSINILAWELSLSFGLVNVGSKEKHAFMQRHKHLYRRNDHVKPLFSQLFSAGRWISLQDVLLAKALSGVKIRIMVWRHGFISYLTRFMYLGEVTIEREVQKLQKKAEQFGLKVKVFHTEFNLPDVKSPFRDPFKEWEESADMVFVIVGNPKGIVSCHHEKLLLIDPELPQRCVAFQGGFDIARGRFDQPLHQPPQSYFNIASFFKTELFSSSSTSSNRQQQQPAPSTTSPTAHYQEGFPDFGGSADDDDDNNSNPPYTNMNLNYYYYYSSNSNNDNNDFGSGGGGKTMFQRRYDDSTIQPLLRHIRFLWHDIQVFIQGPATRQLHLHFAQRWVHAFTRDALLTKNLQLPANMLYVNDPVSSSSTTSSSKKQPIVVDNNSSGSSNNNNEKMHTPTNARIHCNTTVRVLRSWPGVLNRHILLDDYCTMIRNAREYIYVEHQYPFQNYALTHCMCEQLARNPRLLLIVVNPVRTDLPSGIVGDLLDMSQDHINENLSLLQRVAPDRVGIYGLVQQEQHTKKLKTIYVHSKLCIVDDKMISIGSANMDNMSFYRASELNMNIYNPDMARETRIRLFREHLDRFYVSSNGTSGVGGGGGVGVSGSSVINKGNDDEVRHAFNTFKLVSDLNYESLASTGTLAGRVVSMLPRENYHFITKLINYPSPFSKAMYKLGWNPSAMAKTWISNLEASSASHQNPNSFFLQSML